MPDNNLQFCVGMRQLLNNHSEALWCHISCFFYARAYSKEAEVATLSQTVEGERACNYRFTHALVHSGSHDEPTATRVTWVFQSCVSHCLLHLRVYLWLVEENFPFQICPLSWRWHRCDPTRSWSLPQQQVRSLGLKSSKLRSDDVLRLLYGKNKKSWMYYRGFARLWPTECSPVLLISCIELTRICW
jgi:hypothetical protein